MNTQIIDHHRNWNILLFKHKRNQTIIKYWFEGIKGVTTVLANCLLIKYQFICIRILAPSLLDGSRNIRAFIFYLFVLFVLVMI